jgi:hypothetical protein
MVRTSNMTESPPPAASSMVNGKKKKMRRSTVTIFDLKKVICMPP